MKKICIFLAGLFVFLGMLSGCGIFRDEDNPLSGKSTDERIIMALEKAYPEHDFKTVEEYGKHGGEYYAVCADENGLEFRVDTILYDNTYHFGCYDEYLKKVLMAQDFVGKMERIASDNGYSVEINADSQEPLLMVDINIDGLTADQVTETLLEILNCADYIPKYKVEDVEFSTEEIKYFSNPKMYNILCWFYSDQNGKLSIGSLEFNERNKTVNELKGEIESDLLKAYEIDDSMN